MANYFVKHLYRHKYIYHMWNLSVTHVVRYSPNLMSQQVMWSGTQMQINAFTWMNMICDLKHINTPTNWNIALPNSRFIISINSHIYILPLKFPIARVKGIGLTRDASPTDLQCGRYPNQQQIHKIQTGAIWKTYILVVLINAKGVLNDTFAAIVISGSIW
jgi:hypothetical protein